MAAKTENEQHTHAAAACEQTLGIKSGARGSFRSHALLCNDPLTCRDKNGLRTRGASSSRRLDSLCLFAALVDSPGISIAIDNLIHLEIKITIENLGTVCCKVFFNRVKEMPYI